MNKPNARELLKEASDKLKAYYGGNPSDGRRALAIINDIDTYLAAPSESAMEMVEKIREPTMISPTDVSMVPEGLAITYRTDWKLTKSDAAALIEGLQRRVPRAMLDIIYFEGMYDGEKGRDRSTIHLFDDIAAKYGVVIEE